MVCHHIILKKAEVIYLPAFIERYKENRMFIVEEFGTDSNDKDQGLHYHILIEIDKTEARLRADVNKNVRKAKTHGTSYRPWDGNPMYLCKGFPGCIYQKSCTIPGTYRKIKLKNFMTNTGNTGQRCSRIPILRKLRF